MSVLQLMEELQYQAKEAGCTIIIDNPDSPIPPYYTTFFIMPDHPLALERFREFKLFEGIAVFMDRKYFGKTRRNSMHYKKLLELQERFFVVKHKLKIMASAINEVAHLDLSSADHAEKVRAWDASMKLYQDRINEYQQLH